MVDHLIDGIGALLWAAVLVQPEYGTIIIVTRTIRQISMIRSFRSCWRKAKKKLNTRGLDCLCHKKRGRLLTNFTIFSEDAHQWVTSNNRLYLNISSSEKISLASTKLRRCYNYKLEELTSHDERFHKTPNTTSFTWNKFKNYVKDRWPLNADTLLIYTTLQPFKREQKRWIRFTMATCISWWSLPLISRPLWPL